MSESKRYYWIKLKDKFMTSDTVDFLMSQKNGANYVVLYQMLCLKCVNTNGELKREIGEIIIPYDEQKIQRECKYFTLDTVIVALELYKRLGLVYRQENGFLKIANFDNLIGSESESLERVHRFRERKNVDKLPLQCNAECNESVTQLVTECNESVTQKRKREEKKKSNTKENKEERQENLLAKNIKEKITNACAYAQGAGRFDKQIELIIEAMIFACQNEKSEIYAGEQRNSDFWKSVLDDINLPTILAKTVNSLIRYQPTRDETRYTLGIIAGEYDRRGE